MDADPRSARRPLALWAACSAVALTLACGAPEAPASSSATTRGRGAGPPAGSELELVDRFDGDGDGWLNRAERDAALEWLAGYRTPGGVGGKGSEEIQPSAPGPRVAPDDVRSFADAPLYDERTLRTIFIDFEADDWEAELEAFYDTDVDVPATVRVDGREYRDVGVRFRGSTSFQGVPTGSKRSLNLSVDFIHDGQNVGGFRTLNLLNGHNDPTFVRAALFSHIAREYLPTPHVNFVRVVINGESWGVYQSVEQFNKDFLRDHFGETDGVRWKVPGAPGGRAGLEYLGEDPAAYRPWYDLRSKDEPEHWLGLIRLARVLSETPPQQLEAALEPILDVDGALRFLAVEMALVNPDGYWARASDYHLYQDESGRFHVLPHDFNEALGAETFGEKDDPLVDPLVGLDDPAMPLRAKLLAVPSLRERYLEYVREVASRWLDWQVLGPLTAEFRALIEEEVRRDTRKLYGDADFEQGFESLRAFAEQRRAYLLGGG